MKGGLGEMNVGTFISTFSKPLANIFLFWIMFLKHYFLNWENLYLYSSLHISHLSFTVNSVARRMKIWMLKLRRYPKETALISFWNLLLKIKKQQKKLSRKQKKKYLQEWLCTAWMLVHPWICNARYLNSKVRQSYRYHDLSIREKEYCLQWKYE